MPLDKKKLADLIEAFYALYPENHEKKCYFFLDEIQNVEDWPIVIRRFHDSKNVEIFLTGSSAKLLSKEIATSLRGRSLATEIFPFSFHEFLKAKKITIDQSLFDKKTQDLIDFLKNYYIVGGMPEAVKQYIENSADFQSIRKIQQDILDAYELDFSKHADPHDVVKILKVWRSVPVQLAKENKKFMFSKINKKARGREYVDAIEWLEHAGLILKSNLVSSPKLPLSGYVKENSYKIFLLDVGLLGAFSRLSPQVILDENQLFVEFKGSLTENFVAVELTQANTNTPLYYWSSEQRAEIDFLITHNNDIFPLEVKANKGKKTKSLQVYFENFSPRFLLRTSLRNFTQDGNFLNIPLYAIGEYWKIANNYRQKSFYVREK